MKNYRKNNYLAQQQKWNFYTLSDPPRGPAGPKRHILGSKTVLFCRVFGPILDHFSYKKEPFTHFFVTKNGNLAHFNYKREPFAHLLDQKRAFWHTIGIQGGCFHCWFINTDWWTLIWLYVIKDGTPAHLFWPKNRYFSSFGPFNWPYGHQQCYNGVQKGQQICWAIKDDKKLKFGSL